MTINEKRALVQYLELQLTEFCKKLEPNIDVDAIGQMYSAAKELVDDVDDTLGTRVLLSNRFTRFNS